MIRFLIDANLAPRLAVLLAPRFTECVHVQDVLPRGQDQEILEYAIAQNLVVLTKDVDFIDLATLSGAPAKVIRITLGNCRSESIAILLLEYPELIAEFVNDPTARHLSLPGRRSQ